MSEDEQNEEEEEEDKIICSFCGAVDALNIKASKVYCGKCGCFLFQDYSLSHIWEGGEGHFWNNPLTHEERAEQAKNGYKDYNKYKELRHIMKKEVNDIWRETVTLDEWQAALRLSGFYLTGKDRRKQFKNILVYPLEKRDVKHHFTTSHIVGIPEEVHRGIGAGWDALIHMKIALEWVRVNQPKKYKVMQRYLIIEKEREV